MSSVFDKFSEYGQKHDQNLLEFHMRTLNIDELIKEIILKLNTANFIETWNYVFISCRDTPECHKKRIKVVLAVLKELEEKDICNSRLTNILNRICLEIAKFRSEDVVKLCTFCLGCIQSKKNTKMGWKDLLPELLNVLVERETFEIDEIEYTGPEYKKEFLNLLCAAQWSPNIVITLASVFIDMPLSKDEHIRVVNKLGSYIEKLTAQEIPAFVYQLLKLCKHYNGRSIFLRLQTYFGLRIYNKSNVDSETSPDTNTIDLDAIESANNQDTIDAESTVLYHIHTSASLGHECVKDFLNSLKNTVKAPEFVLHPFQLMVLFSISTIPHYEETVFEIIRPCIVRSYSEEQRKFNSCWFREMVPTTGKPEDVFAQVIHYSFQDRDLVLQALVNFAFVLLGIGSALGRDIIAEKQWNLGNMILLKIIKRKRDVAPTIIQNLSNNIVTRQFSSQYIECLYILSKTLPLLMLESQACIVELMDSLVQIPGTVANQLLDALMPLTKVSSTLRDHLIILLRKALYSRAVETRQMAVLGFLKLIRQLKISNMASLSQSNTSSFTSGHSLFTQISLSRSSQSVYTSAFSNEALCLEVLNILKRCFMQQCEVRSQLYEGLYDSISMNPELGIPALDVIWFHFSDFYIMDEEHLPPLDFKKIAVIKDVDAILIEPISKLVYTVGLIVTQVSKIDEHRDNATLTKFANILESLCERMQNCELVHFELDDGTDLHDILPESQQKVLILKEAMSVYEALIGYKIYSWTKESENQGRTINSLFQGYNRLAHFSKTLTKSKKKDGKRRKADNNRTTEPSQSNTAVKKDEQRQSKTFKIPDTTLDLRCIKKGLSLLHEPTVSWTTMTEANIVKSKREFHQHIMQATMFLVQNVKRHKDIENQVKKYYYDHVTDIAVILFERIVRRLNEFIDFDCTTAILALGCFQSILSLMNSHYKSNLKSFLNKVVSEDMDRTIVEPLTVIFEVYRKLFGIDEDEASEDPEIKKLSVIVITTISTLTSLIPNETNALSVEMFEWLKTYAYNNTVTSKVSGVFVNLFFDVHIKYKVSLTLIEQFSVSIGDVMGVLTEDDHKSEEFKIINEASVQNILLSLCSCVKSILDDIEAVIARLRSEYSTLMYPAVENLEKKQENLKTKEKGVCLQACFVVTILTNLSNLVIQPGNMSETIFKSIILCFGTLSQLTKYFMFRSSKVNLAFQGARYERLVKLAGKQLAPAVYKFILHIEDSQKPETQATQTKKKQKSLDAGVLKSKILKETRLIPKMVYEIEQFGKCVIQLSNKTKVDLAKYIGQGISRDFRILQLKEVLEEHGENVADVSISTQSTADENPEEEEQDSANSDSQENEGDEDVPPPKKRRK